MKPKPKDIYYQAILTGKSIKLEPKDKKEVKRDKFKKIKSIVTR